MREGRREINEELVEIMGKQLKEKLIKVRREWLKRDVERGKERSFRKNRGIIEGDKENKRKKGTMGKDKKEEKKEMGKREKYRNRKNGR